jgi:hypothetical protein
LQIWINPAFGDLFLDGIASGAEKVTEVKAGVCPLVIL